MAKEYNISRPTGTCAGCDRAFEVGDGFFTILKDTDEELARNDFCLDCWDKNPQQGEGILGVWRGKIPAKQEKKRVFIDDELLVSFFSSLEGTEDPSRISLRFVVALALMQTTAELRWSNHHARWTGNVENEPSKGRETLHGGESASG